MAVSAYDPSGRLKKHALLGTSFAIDPTQAEKRRKFKDLYEEARLQDTKSREATKGRLSARLKGYEQEQASRLAKIAEQKMGFEEELANLKTPEERLASYTFIPPTFAPAPGEITERKLNLLQRFRQEYANRRGELGAAYSALQKEEEERSRRLKDRLELYNMFLGA